MYCVYMHTAPNGKKYIGITKRNAKSRWAKGLGYRDNKHFFNAIIKYGWENIQHEIIKTNLSKEEAKAMEVELIAMYNLTNPQNGYNRTVGGDAGTPLFGEANGMYGRGHTEKTKKKQSEIAKVRFENKENHPMYGTHRTDETKEKLSIAHKGRIAGELNYFYGKHLTGKDAYAYGIKRSDETKRKISELRKGKYMGEDAWNAKKIKNINTGEIFNCVMDVKRKYGYDNSALCRCCVGKQKTAYGYTWEYI